MNIGPGDSFEKLDNASIVSEIQNKPVDGVIEITSPNLKVNDDLSMSGEMTRYVPQPQHHITHAQRAYGTYAPLAGPDGLHLGANRVNTDLFLAWADRAYQSMSNSFGRSSPALSSSYRSLGGLSGRRGYGREPSPASLATELRLRGYRGQFLSLPRFERMNRLRLMQALYGFKLEPKTEKILLNSRGILPKYILTEGTGAPVLAPHAPQYGLLRNMEYAMPVTETFTISRPAAFRLARKAHFATPSPN
jgi:hypothetical protein